MTKTYVLTSAQAQANPQSDYFQGLNRYIKEVGAEPLIILPMIGQNAREDIDQLHKELWKYDIEGGKRKLNNNVEIWSGKY